MDTFSIENFPSISVNTPDLLPLMTTVAPMSGCPSSPEITTPFTLNTFACLEGPLEVIVINDLQYGILVAYWLRYIESLLYTLILDGARNGEFLDIVIRKQDLISG